jgi:hypothetical protein
MGLFSSLFQPKLFLSDKVWVPFKVGCYIVLACIILQSSFLMAASLESNENAEQYNEIIQPFNFIIAEHTHERAAILAQAVIQNECLDCNIKSCQCCSNNLFISASLMSDLHAIELPFRRFQIVGNYIFYDLLLRPPKAYIEPL